MIQATTQEAAERVAELATWDVTPSVEEFARCKRCGGVGAGNSSDHRIHRTLKTIPDAVVTRNPRNICILGGCLVPSQVFQIIKRRAGSSGAGEPDQGPCGGSATLYAQDAGVFSDRYLVARSDPKAPTIFGG